MEEINSQNVDQQPTTQPADNGKQGSGERTFTQSEVDRIVKERLARERAKAAPQEPTEAEKREKELASRESRLNCRAYLLDNGYPAELLDIVDTSDPKEFAKKADIVHGLLRTSKGAAPMYDPAPALRKTNDPVSSGRSAGFASTKHVPRKFPSYLNYTDTDY